MKVELEEIIHIIDAVADGLVFREDYGGECGYNKYGLIELIKCYFGNPDRYVLYQDPNYKWNWQLLDKGKLAMQIAEHRRAKAQIQHNQIHKKELVEQAVQDEAERRLNIAQSDIEMHDREMARLQKILDDAEAKK